MSVNICGRTVTLSYPNSSLRKLEEKVGYSILGKVAKNDEMNVAKLVDDTAAWLWAGSLKDPNGSLDYDAVVKALDDMTLRETAVFKDAIAKEFENALPEKKDENPPVPANPAV